MGKTTEELNNSKAGSTAESNGFGGQEKPQRPGGVYELRDKENKLVDTQIVKTHPLFGDSQAAAFERVGYEFVREAKPDEVKTLDVAPQQQLSDQSSKEEVKGIMARLSAIETTSKEKDDVIAGLRAELANSNDGDSIKEKSMKEAADEGERQVAAREAGGNTAVGAESTKTGSSDVVPNSNPNSTTDLGNKSNNQKRNN